MIALDSKRLTPNGVAMMGGLVARIRSKPLAALDELLAAWKRTAPPWQP